MVAAETAPSYALRLGIEKDQVVQELGWDEDTDDDIRADIEDACGGELLDEDADEVIDVVLLWWRDDDGDLVDRLMDAITPAGRRWRDLGGHPQDRQTGTRTACGDRRVGADRGADADVVGEPRRLDRAAGWCSRSRRPSRRAGRYVSSKRRRATEAPDFTLKDQNGQPVTLSVPAASRTCCWCSSRSRSPASVRASSTRSGTICRLRERRHPDAGDLGGAAADPQGLGDRARLHVPGAVGLLAARRGGQAYGVFNDDAGFANRGTFVVDRSGIIRFAEMKQPGEPRDQAVWTEALGGA